ncbi:MAG TPA: GNAT family N-acetyltransferase [Acidimicrobiia bacterium]|nr:GNAT family N-acetyltransferase [Acidimicrobiia bacterium]
MPQKLRYEIDLSGLTLGAGSHDPRVRSISRADHEGLARLMLDAYVGTIDYEDEGLEDAIEEVRSFLDDGDALLDRSYLVEDDGTIVSAVLVSLYEGMPFVGYVMTLPPHKDQGLARLVTVTALERLAADGHETVVLYITAGNTPSEALFRSVGAVQVES